MSNTTTITSVHPLTKITDGSEHHLVRAAAMVDLICATPNSRSSHRDYTATDIEVYNLPHGRGTNIYMETPDMETYLHIVGVVTREAAENGYSVDVYQNGWNVQFMIKVAPYTKAKVETEWIIVHTDGPDWKMYYSTDIGWTPLRERATGFDSQADADYCLSNIFPAKFDPRTRVREVEVTK